MAKLKHDAPDYEVMIKKLLSLRNQLEIIKNNDNKPKRITQVIDNQYKRS